MYFVSQFRPSSYSSFYEVFYPRVCSQFCVEPAASVVDASAVWHGTASVPGDDSGCNISSSSGSSIVL